MVTGWPWTGERGGAGAQIKTEGRGVEVRAAMGTAARVQGRAGRCKCLSGLEFLSGLGAVEGIAGLNDIP